MPAVTTIAELLQTEPPKVIPQVHGTIAVIAERYPPTGWMEETNSDGSKRLWSLQTIVLEQNGAQIECQIANKDPIPAEAKGRSLYLLAHQKSRGGLSGVKLDVDEGRKILRVSASGELVFAEPAAKISAPEAKQPGAPTPQKPISVTTPANASSLIETETKPGGGTPAASGTDLKAWEEIGKAIDKFGDLYELCQARAARMNIAAEAEVLAVSDKLFAAMLDWFRGDLPGELPSGKPPK